MENLFNPSVRKEIINRIGHLHSDRRPLWGKMNAAQMLAHCQFPLKIGFGDVVAKRSFIGWLFGKIAKKQFMKNTHFKKNLPTDPTFIINDARDLDAERNKLIQLIERFAQGPDSITKQSHPFFGKMTPDEWSILSWKHLDHHLRQFGM